MEEPIIEEPIMEESIIEESTITIKEHLDDCSICLEKIVNDDKHITSCNHTFHEECMAIWMSLNNSCPLCRKNLDLHIYDEIDDDEEIDEYNDGYDDDGNPIYINRSINNSNTNNNISYNNTSLPDSLHVFAVNYNVLRIMSGMG
jgi:hypothetical protein